MLALKTCMTENKTSRPKTQLITASTGYNSYPALCNAMPKARAPIFPSFIASTQIETPRLERVEQKRDAREKPDRSKVSGMSRKDGQANLYEKSRVLDQKETDKIILYM